MIHFDIKELCMRARPLLALFSVALIGALFKNEPLFFLLNKFAEYRPFFWLHLTHLAEVLVAVSLFSIFIYKHPKLLWSLAISIALCVFVVQGLKHAIDAPRPPAVLAVDEILVIIPTLQDLRPLDPTIDFEYLIDSRPDTAAAWQAIKSNPNSREARYWIPRMGKIVTKEQFGIVFYRETIDLKQGTYRGIYRPNSRSFPSGHTATIACALTLLLLYFRMKNWAWILAALALLIGCSRIVVGVHWPLDVAVGGLIGCATSIAGTWLSIGVSSASTAIGHRIIVLLPGLAALILCIRTPIYPEIANFEMIVGGSSLLLSAASLWFLYRNR